MGNSMDSYLRVIILIMGIVGLGISVGKGLNLYGASHLRGITRMSCNIQESIMIHFDDGSLLI
jgi:hypothetical protein